MRIDLEVLSSFDLNITTSTSDSECVSKAEEQMPNPKRCTTLCELCLTRGPVRIMSVETQD